MSTILLRQQEYPTIDRLADFHDGLFTQVSILDFCVLVWRLVQTWAIVVAAGKPETRFFIFEF